MKILGTFVTAWAAASFGLYQWVTHDQVIPAGEVLSFQVGSAALALIPAAALAAAAKKVG